MLDIERVLKSDRLLRALTGLNRKAFEELVLTFESVYQQSQMNQTQAQRPRQRAVGGGQKARLGSREAKLFFILVYFKCYPTFDVLGLLFDLDYSRANRWVHRLQPILEAALGQKLMLPERKLGSVAAFIQRFPEVKRVIIDGTERPIRRAQDSQQQQQNYSGKKRRHTRKHLAATEAYQRILILSPAREGKIHDKRLLDETQMASCIPDEVPIAVDLGFQGLQNEWVNLEIPHKKPRGGTLSDEQKQENRELSRRRVKCEHAFAGMKRYNAVAHV
jgi:hypothetical protein